MLLCISGSLRKDSCNTRLATEAARAYGGDFALADLRLPLYDGDLEDAEGIPAQVAALDARIREAEAVVIATPEYNKSLSGVLKNALDWVSRTKGNPWLRKPVAFMSAADGREGGARANYALRLAMTPFRPRVSCGPEVLIAQCRDAFDADGRLISERYLKTLGLAMTALRDEAGG